MQDFDFPISDYYRERIIDAETIARSGGWWTAVLVIKDPRTDKPFINLYRWQKSGEEWKVRKSFPIRSNRVLLDLLGALQRAGSSLSDD
jgi:hypothetical protein